MPLSDQNPALRLLLPHLTSTTLWMQLQWGHVPSSEKCESIDNAWRISKEPHLSKHSADWFVSPLHLDTVHWRSIYPMQLPAEHADFEQARNLTTAGETSYGFCEVSESGQVAVIEDVVTKNQCGSILPRQRSSRNEERNSGPWCAMKLFRSMFSQRLFGCILRLNSGWPCYLQLLQVPCFFANPRTSHFTGTSDPSRCRVRVPSEPPTMCRMQTWDLQGESASKIFKVYEISPMSPTFRCSLKRSRSCNKSELSAIS